LILINEKGEKTLMRLKSALFKIKNRKTPLDEIFKFPLLKEF